MKFAVVIHHEPGSTYGVTVPDLPGCFSAGATFDEAFEHVLEAIELHLEGLEAEGMDIPRSTGIDIHRENPDFAGGIWGFVDVDITPYLGNTEKINVTLPSAIIRKIDAKHSNRSRFLSEAAWKALSEFEPESKTRPRTAAASMQAKRPTFIAKPVRAARSNKSTGARGDKNAVVGKTAARKKK